MEKIAIIELNEKAVRLSIYKVSGSKYKLCLTQTQPLAVGVEVYREELLSPQMKNKILEILKVYRRMTEGFGVERIFAVSSNIISRARNYRGFIDEIYNNTGINFTILTDEEYVKCIFNSVVGSIDNAKGVFLCVGSFTSYLVRYNRRAILNIVVLPFGTFTIGDKAKSLEDIVKYVKENINKEELYGGEEEFTKFVGVGNIFLAMGQIAKKIERYPVDIENNYTISNATVEKTYKFISDLELEKIRKIKGVDYEDADKLASGFAIIEGIKEALNFEEITISTADLRTGVLGVNVISLAQERFNDLLSNSFDNYFEFSKNEFSINQQVHDLALILFKQLKVMHKLPRFYVKPLRIASFMYDSGKAINEEKWTKYGFDAIVYSTIRGATHRELLIAGFICICQNLDDFSLNEWIKYKDILTDEDLDAVRKLGIIVKLAVSLNASRNNAVKDIVCDILGDSIIMKTVVDKDASFEIEEGMTVAQDYKKVYKKSLQII